MTKGPAGRCLFAFGLFAFDPRSGELARRDRPVALRPQAGRLLTLLLERAGDLVTRDELREHLWGRGTYVDHERGLNSCVRQVRRALGDDAAQPRFVETLPGRGYRFIAPVETLPAAAPGRSPEPAAPAEVERSPVRPADGPPVLLWVASLLALVALTVLAARDRTAAEPPPAPAAGELVSGELVSGELAGASGESSPAAARWVVATFQNRTGEAVLDDSLAAAFRLGFERARPLRVLPAPALRQALARMGELSDEAAEGELTAALLDRRLAAEVAVREGAGEVVAGWVDKLGERYLLAAEVVDSASGEVRAAASEEAAGHGELLDALDKVIDSVHRQLLAAPPVERSPLARVTTPDLTALEAYSQAVTLVEAGRWDEALLLLERAVDRDPDFAMARALLGNLLVRHRGDLRGIEEVRRARGLQHRLTERDRAYIDAWLIAFDAAAGWPEVEAAWRRVAVLHPEHHVGHHNLAVTVMQMGDRYEAALASFEKAMAVARIPDRVAASRRGRALALLALGRTDEALAEVEQLYPREAAGGLTGPRRAHFALGLGLHDEAAALVGDEPCGEPLACWLAALLELERGRPAAAAERAGSLASMGSGPRRIDRLCDLLIHLELLAEAAAADGDRGLLAERIEAERAAVAGRPRERLDASSDAGLALRGQVAARSGELLAALSFQAALERKEPTGVTPAVRRAALAAEILLAQGEAAAAAARLEAAIAGPAAYPLHLREVLGRAREAAGDPAGAREEYRWVVERRGRAFVECLDGNPCLDQTANVAAWNRARDRLAALSAGASARSSARSSGRSSGGR